jgi:hypothetical protein
MPWPISNSHVAQDHEFETSVVDSETHIVSINRLIDTGLEKMSSFCEKLGLPMGLSVISFFIPRPINKTKLLLTNWYAKIIYRNFPLPTKKIDEFTMGCNETENLLEVLPPSVLHWEKAMSLTELGNATSQDISSRKEICINGLLMCFKFFCLMVLMKYNDIFGREILMHKIYKSFGFINIHIK